MTNKQSWGKVEKEFYKFCDDNGFNPARNECVDWWINKIQYILTSKSKQMEREVNKIRNNLASNIDTDKILNICLEILKK